MLAGHLTIGRLSNRPGQWSTQEPKSKLYSIILLCFIQQDKSSSILGFHRVNPEQLIHPPLRILLNEIITNTSLLPLVGSRVRPDCNRCIPPPAGWSVQCHVLQAAVEVNQSGHIHTLFGV